MWSATVDPCVLRARVAAPRSPSQRMIDLSASDVRCLRDDELERIAIDRPGRTIRIDLHGEAMLGTPIALLFEIVDDERLDRQIEAMRLLRSCRRNVPGEPALARHFRALKAFDARKAGRSLREIADLVLGPGDWPGDGECRKSLVRRMIINASRMIEAGPSTILQIKARHA